MYFQKNQVTHWIFHGMVPERIALEVLIIFLLQEPGSILSTWLMIALFLLTSALSTGETPGSISNRERRSHLIDLLSSTVVQTDLTEKKRRYNQLMVRRF